MRLALRGPAVQHDCRQSSRPCDRLLLNPPLTIPIYGSVSMARLAPPFIQVTMPPVRPDRKRRPGLGALQALAPGGRLPGWPLLARRRRSEQPAGLRGALAAERCRRRLCLPTATSRRPTQPPAYVAGEPRRAAGRPATRFAGSASRTMRDRTRRRRPKPRRCGRDRQARDGRGGRRDADRDRPRADDRFARRSAARSGRRARRGDRGAGPHGRRQSLRGARHQGRHLHPEADARTGRDRDVQRRFQRRRLGRGAVGNDAAPERGVRLGEPIRRRSTPTALSARRCRARRSTMSRAASTARSNSTSATTIAPAPRSAMRSRRNRRPRRSSSSAGRRAASGRPSAAASASKRTSARRASASPAASSTTAMATPIWKAAACCRRATAIRRSNR